MLDAACLSDDELIHYAQLGMVLPTEETLRRLAELAAMQHHNTET